MKSTVVVTERGEKRIGASLWHSLEKEPAFWDLVDAGVVEAKQLRDGGARLTGTCYVGRALCGETLLECAEKVPGALLAMLQTGLGRFLNLKSPAPLTELGVTVELIVKAFLAQVSRYVTRGRRWEYGLQRAVSSLVGGRIHMPSTIALRARGARHLVAFDRPVVTHSIVINQLLAAALLEVDSLRRLVDLSERVVSEARQLSLFFEDCLGRATERIVADPNTIPALLQDPAYSDYELMISLAGIILSHSDIDSAEPTYGTAPISWFLNLETLFEDAVRHTLASAVGSGGSVIKGGAEKRYVFPALERLRADPDLVIRMRDSDLVGDVKYKTWTGTAAASDLYQLLAHIDAFGGTTGFLIYPSDRFSEVSLGASVSGVNVRLFSLDVRDIGDGIEQLLERLGVDRANRRRGYPSSVDIGFTPLNYDSTLDGPLNECV